MSRIRTIKPELWTSADFIDLSLEGKLAFICLINHADDEGRMKTSGRHLAHLIGTGDVSDQLAVMREHLMIEHYQVDGAWYVQLTSWRAHQKIDRPTPSRIPPPPDSRSLRRGVAEDSPSVQGQDAEDSLSRARRSDRSIDQIDQGVRGGTEAAKRSRARDRVLAWLGDHSFEADVGNATKLCVSEGWTDEVVIAACEKARRLGAKRPLTYIQAARDGHSSLLSRVMVQLEEAAHEKRKGDSRTAFADADGQLSAVPA